MVLNDDPIPFVFKDVKILSLATIANDRHFTWTCPRHSNAPRPLKTADSLSRSAQGRVTPSWVNLTHCDSVPVVRQCTPAIHRNGCPKLAIIRDHSFNHLIC